MTIAGIQSDHVPAWHLEKFVDFTKAKAEIGEPSPHMTIVGYLSKDLPVVERMWYAGCYLNAYSIGTAEAMYAAWNYEQAVWDPGGLEAWIHDHWEGFHTRTERRMVRTPAAFAKAQLSYLVWLQDAVPILRQYRHLPPEALYDLWWASIIGLDGWPGIHNFGRYITIRLIEFVNRYGGEHLPLYDIRSIGAESPIRALMLFRPDRAADLATGKRDVVDEVAEGVLAEARTVWPDISHYVFAAMLCEYREAYEDHHQYPGRTHDQELQYATHPKLAYWEESGRLFEARAALFPHEVLGEKHGWLGIRHELSYVLRDRGMVWSDLRYKYPADLAA